MPVEAIHWQARCVTCDELYGEYHATREEAQAYDDEGDNRCTDCGIDAAFGGSVSVEETPR